MRSRHWTEPPGRSGYRSQPAHTGSTQWPDHRPRAASSNQVSTPSLMGYYSFNQPRRDGRLSWPCWLTDSGRFTHKVVTRPAVSLAQDRESLPARTGGLTTMLHHQLYLCLKRMQLLQQILVHVQKEIVQIVFCPPTGAHNECKSTSAFTLYWILLTKSVKYNLYYFLLHMHMYLLQQLRSLQTHSY